MTFRIDSIYFDHERWVCSFKGFQGEGVYAQARLNAAGTTLILTSTMNCSDQVTLPVVSLPVQTDRPGLHAWLVAQLVGLGWGPEVDQAGRLVASASQTEKRAAPQ